MNTSCTFPSLKTFFISSCIIIFSCFIITTTSFFIPTTTITTIIINNHNNNIEKSRILLHSSSSSAAATEQSSNIQQNHNKNIINNNNDNNNDDNNSNLNTFISCLESMSLPKQKQNNILSIIQQTMDITSSNELYFFTIDFKDRPEILSHILKNDFDISVGNSHLIRGALMRLVDVMENEENNNNVDDNNDNDQNDDSRSSNIISRNDNDEKDSSSSNQTWGGDTTTTTTTTNNNNNNNNILATPSSLVQKEKEINTSEQSNKSKQPLFKSVIVNTKAKQRMSKISSSSSSSSSNKNIMIDNNYGLAPNYKSQYPKLGQEIDDFLLFMIQPSTKSSQESPIRQATATVYIRHAKLFLGWWTKVKQTNNGNKEDKELSLYDIFPNNEAKSAQPIVDFILWLRQTRDISNSYEANMLRGLTKLLKYRFCQESEADPSYGEKSFADIPAVRELRKLHRDANRRQTLSPRSSEEDRKWLDWSEFLDVIKAMKTDLLHDISQWEQQNEGKQPKRRRKNESNDDNDSKEIIYTASQRRIATAFQAYLILAFFSCVPDRQRTFRELELGKTFLKDDSINCWTIKHGPNDYKTGSTYGDRPPLVIAEELTSAIDDFLARWRKCLTPTGQHFFVQPRTGNPFTQDSVYSIVARSCYKYKGKKTNPHLLRDMIVTKIRDSNASEKELEALALYMGHSINMQRTSYDRRTMKQKVAPAVQLLQSVNSSGNKNEKE